MKRQSLFLIASLAPAFALATPTVTFLGEVSDQTCEAMINGETNSIVLLPTVSANELNTAKTAGLTPFTIRITGCVAPDQTLREIHTRFLGHNVTMAGNLGNQAVDNPAGDVQIQLTSDADGNSPIQLNGATSAPGLKLAVGTTSTSYTFGAQYITENDQATPGNVEAVAEYTLEYP